MVGPTSITREKPTKLTHFTSTDGKLVHINIYLEYRDFTIGYFGTSSSYFSETEPAMVVGFLNFIFSNVCHLDLLKVICRKQVLNE